MKDLIKKEFWKSVKKTINKFREHPYYFFTESDIVSYFYYCFYSSSFETQDALKKRIFLAHREYPTNFRYDKEKLHEDKFTEPYNLKSNLGTRGNYDLAILDPVFVQNAETVEDVVNKNIKLLLKRNAGTDRELLFSVEFKYVINNNKNFVKEIKMDNKKLLFSEKHQSCCGVNLVFCNKTKPNSSFDKEICKVVRGSEVITIFTHSFYNPSDNEKVTPKPKTNSKMDDYYKDNSDILEKPFWELF